jgi:hypothetical protein
MRIAFLGVNLLGKLWFGKSNTDLDDCFLVSYQLV